MRAPVVSVPPLHVDGGEERCAHSPVTGSDAGTVGHPHFPAARRRRVPPPGQAPSPSPARGRRLALLRRGLAALLLCALLAACGGRAGLPSTAPGGRAPAARPGETTVASAAASTAAAAASMAGAAAPAPGMPPAAAHGQAAILPDLPAGQMLVRTASIELEGADPAATAASVQQVAASAAAGADAGYVADEHEQWNGSALTATLTIRVPAPAFAAVMEQLRHLGKVVNETSSSQDVSEQYVDVDAQLQALRATEAQLLQLLGKTQQLADTIAVQSKLTDVEAQINQLEGRERYLTQHSAYSTITVSIHPPAAVAAPAATWSPLATLQRAASALGAVGQGVASALIWLLVFGLPLAALGLAALGLYRLGRRLLGERRAEGRA